MSVRVKWASDEFGFKLPPPDTTVADIRRFVASCIHLPCDAFSLVLDGAVMADDKATVSAYHIDSNSVIVIETSTPEPSSFRITELAQIASIQAEINSVHVSLLPAHSQLLSQLTPQTRSAFEKERARISELLTQALIRVDAIIPEHYWTNARAQRKQAVNQLQSLLDELDSAWAAVA